MWCLSRLLSLMIGDRVPESDPRWKNFLLLLEIIDYVFAPVISPSGVAYIHLIIMRHSWS